MSSGRHVAAIGVRVLAACIVAFLLLVGVLALADIEDNSTGDDIAEAIYLAIWVVAALALIAVVAGGIAALRDRSR